MGHFQTTPWKFLVIGDIKSIMDSISFIEEMLHWCIGEYFEEYLSTQKASRCLYPSDLHCSLKTTCKFIGITYFGLFSTVMLNYNFISGSWSYISAFMKVSQWKKCIWKKYQADFIPGICLLESVLTEMSPVQHTTSTLGWLATLRNNYIPVRYILCTCTAEKCRLEKHRETFEEKHLAVKRSPTADDFKLKYNIMYLCRSHPWPLLMYFSQKSNLLKARSVWEQHFWAEGNGWSSTE